MLCCEDLTERHYWEAEWRGGAAIGVAYREIGGGGDDCELGCNDKSWSLDCSSFGYSAIHNGKSTVVPFPSSGSLRVGVYLDWPGGILSFYSITSNTLTHLHTFHSTFKESLYPGFKVLWSDCSVSLYQR